jgi:alkylated DNA nucleotide flippase Atl1
MEFFILYCERPAMASSRAQEVAEVLWELKRADKVATFSSIAGRAGFSAGANGRTVVTCLKTVRRDWSHLHWWRAIRDDGTIEKGSEQESKLRESGFELQDAEKEAVTIASIEEHLMHWDENGKPVPAVAASK